MKINWDFQRSVQDGVSNGFHPQEVVGGTPYIGLYWEALPKRGTFFRLQIYKRVGISQVEMYKRVGESVG